MRTALVVLALLVASAAWAQEPTGSRPLRPFGAIPPPSPAISSFLFQLGEPSGAASSLPALYAVTPVRLSLQGEVFPVDHLFDACGTRGESAGNARGGIPLQRYTFLQLTPSLALHGFSASGCPIDGAMGGALTYAIPIRPSWWIVFGGGFYGAPARPVGGSRVNGDVHVDLVHRTPDGHAFTLGVGRRGVSFGGVF